MMLGCLLWVASAALAAEPQTYVLNTTLPVWDIAAQDVNGDGHNDLFALCSDPDARPLKKSVAVFVAQPDGGYPPQPSLTIPLDPAIGVLFFAEVDGAAPKELVAMDARGATVYRYGDGAFTTDGPKAFPSLLPSGTQRPAFLANAATDLDGDGRDEWLIPVTEGIQIRHADGLVASVACAIHSEILRKGSWAITYHLPDVRPFKLPGELTKGLAFLSDDIVEFAHGADWATRNEYVIPTKDKQEWRSTVIMNDVNEDGLPDFVVTQTKGTVQMEMVTDVYIATAPFTYPAKPTATFATSGAMSSPTLADVDGDKKLDLVFVRVPFSVKTIINLFLRNRMTLQVAVHRYRDGGYADAPDYEDNLTIQALERREQLAYAMGDFTGDGFLDAALGADENALAIHTGGEGNVLSSKPAFTLSIPAYGEARALPLNGNAGQDLVVFHPDGALSKRIDVILF